MKEKIDQIWYIASTALFGLLAVLFVGVFITSLGKNAIDICVRVGWDWRHTGNYVSLFSGFIAYAVFAIILKSLKISHNLDWFMKFTHELTHTLVALFFCRKIHEFVVRGRQCYVHYDSPKIGYLPITLSPYCIPIYTLMIFPFRFAGDNQYMIIFDALIAFTYAFHVQTFIKQTRFTQNDIENCGIAQSVTYLAFNHLAILSLILAIPKGGVLKALSRVFWEYPWHILTDPSGWFHEIIKFYQF